MGREQRLANRAQRRALRAMYRTCAAKGCTVTFERCHIHHVKWWELLGPSNLDNLLPLCGIHHHLVHEGGWHLTLDQDRNLTMIRPDGQTHAIVPFTDIARAGPNNRRQPTAAPGPDPGSRRPPPGQAPPPGPEPPQPSQTEPQLFTTAR